MKILVRNLSRETTEAALLTRFKQYGDVQYCKIVMDPETGKSKGFGFVEMPRAGEAKVAIKGLNASEVDGSKIRVKKAETNRKAAPPHKAGEPSSLLKSAAGDAGQGGKRR
jgi:RNA recognition motif-containing protein